MNAPAQDRRVSAVIVNWNTSELLARCLTSLEEHGAGIIDEVVVVDNASTDDSVARVQREHPRTHVIVNPTNLGYQRANNIGMRATKSGSLLLINSDAFLSDGALPTLVDALADEKVGVVGPRLEYGDGSFQRWTAGRAPTFRASTVWALGLDRVLPRAGVYLGRDEAHPFDPEWVSSACMLVRRCAYEAVGPMDESFFAYMDDVDYCRRVRVAGWSIRYEPRAQVVHLMGASSGRIAGAAVSPVAIRTFQEYVRRREGRVAGFGCRAAQVAGFGTRAAAYRAAAMARPARGDDLRQASRAHFTHLRIALGAT